MPSDPTYVSHTRQLAIPVKRLASWRNEWKHARDLSAISVGEVLRWHDAVRYIIQHSVSIQDLILWTRRLADHALTGTSWQRGQGSAAGDGRPDPVGGQLGR